MNVYCPDCQNPLEVIKACGCTDYFCNHCNQLVSKRRALSEPGSTDSTEDLENESLVNVSVDEPNDNEAQSY